MLVQPSSCGTVPSGFSSEMSKGAKSPWAKNGRTIRMIRMKREKRDRQKKKQKRKDKGAGYNRITNDFTLAHPQTSYRCDSIAQLLVWMCAHDGNATTISPDLNYYHYLHPLTCTLTFFSVQIVGAVQRLSLLDRAPNIIGDFVCLKYESGKGDLARTEHQTKSSKSFLHMRENKLQRKSLVLLKQRA